MLTCFKHLSAWPVSGAPSKRLVIIPRMEDREVDKAADKWVVPGCNLEEADCTLQEAACHEATEELVLATSSSYACALGRTVVAANELRG